MKQELSATLLLILVRCIGKYEVLEGDKDKMMCDLSMEGGMDTRIHIYTLASCAS